MESMRDTRRIMEKEIKKGSTPLRFEKISIDETCYQEIISREKFLEVLRYLHRVGEYKTYANKMVINNVYTYMRMNTPDFTRARSIFDREKIYHQMLRQEKKLQPNYDGDCYIETAKCIFHFQKFSGKNAGCNIKMKIRLDLCYRINISWDFISIAGKQDEIWR